MNEDLKREPMMYAKNSNFNNAWNAFSRNT
jgi:hypothetical protein